MGALIDWLNNVNGELVAWTDSVNRRNRTFIATSALSGAIGGERIYLQSALKYATTVVDNEEMLERKGPEFRRLYEQNLARVGAALAAHEQSIEPAGRAGVEYEKPDFTVEIGGSDLDIEADIRSKIELLREERAATFSDIRRSLVARPRLRGPFREKLKERGLAALWDEGFSDMV